MKMVRYNKDATQIVNDSGVVIATILTMANDTFRLYDLNDIPISKVNYTTRKKAFDAYTLGVNA